MRLTSLLRTLFRGTQLDRDLDDELRTYLEHRIAVLVAGGVPPAEARRRVLAAEGGVEPIKEGARAARIGAGVVDFLQDARYGWRSMRRAPGYTALACLTLALGIGTTVAMFTVMRSVLWTPLPYPAPERLVTIETDARGLRNQGSAPAEVLDFRARSRTLQQVATISGVEAHVTINGELERLSAASVSDDLLPLLGPRLASGRLMTEARDVGSTSVKSVIISERLAARLGSRGAVGHTLDFNNLAIEIVGIMPSDFRLFLPASIAAEEEIDVWFPAETPDARDYRGHNVLARLAPGASLADAQRELDAIAASLEREHPAVYRDAAIRYRVTPLHAALTSGAAPGLLVLGLAVAFVLLVSCVNVANLMLARASGRTRELAVRRALGAGRARILRQLLTESLLLSVIAGATGLLMAHAGIQLLDWLRPTHLPRQSQVAMDAVVAGFALAISLAAGLVFGCLPAVRFAAADAQALRAGRGESASRASRRLQRSLVVAEIALSIIPLVAAGLMLRSFVNMTQAPLGFEPDHVVTAQLPMSFRRFPMTPNGTARIDLYASAVDRLRELPGVDAASAASPMPFAPLQTTRRYGRDDGRVPGSQATMQSVMPGYLGVVGTRLLAGRDFTADDNRARRPVVIVDARMAESLWPDGAIGRTLMVGSGRRATGLEVIGVTEPVRVREIRDDGVPHFFVPYHHYQVEMTMVMRTTVPATALEPAVKKALGALGTGRAVHDVKPMGALVAGAMADARFTTLVLSGFAVAAVLLAAVGLYGTLAYLTAQRAREFGVRLALGATSRQILGLVAREGLILTVVGLGLGIAGAIAAARAMRGLLFGIEPLDPATLGAVTSVLAAVALAAILRPAVSAANVDPVTALRAD